MRPTAAVGRFLPRPLCRAFSTPAPPPLSPRPRTPKRPRIPRVAPPPPPPTSPPPTGHRMAICLNSELGMSKGKLCAQAAHGALSAFRAAHGGTEAQRTLLRAWLREGQAKVVLRAAGEDALLALHAAAVARGLPCSLVRDAGRTQVAAGSLTCVALGPGAASDLAEVTGELKLL